ncbi:recombinase family protein [Salinarimonas sp.]|uniref:recombinase family protein n=1 Tax=Salinarimonas sp. TaxID=2766526 RepID=UPI00391C584F
MRDVDGRDTRGRDAAVGFYWTRPVNWAGFTRLPRDVEEAGQASRTIRYQMERVRAWARDNAVALVEEVPFLDLRTDRVTDACGEALAKARARCAERAPLLLCVRFDYGSSPWRSHPKLREIAGELGFLLVELEPIAVDVDGMRFDPIRHFEEWRDLDEVTRAGFRANAEAKLIEAAERIVQTRGRYAAIADLLNAEGVPTKTGKAWTEETVRKMLRQTMWST